MAIDIREDAAQFYDLNPTAPDDLEFYRGKIPGSDARILELGCGTGRVLLPLVESCGFIHGVDASPAMISICRDKMRKAGIPARKAEVEIGDITDVTLGKTFDLVIAPCRVFQHLETDVEIEDFLETVRKHLSAKGTCVLNVFKPNLEPEKLRHQWANKEEYLAWETLVEGERITCHGRNVRMDAKNMVLYPEIIYRRYQGEDLKEEVVLQVVMRCYYPEEFEHVIREHGFEILHRWGGYAGEPYGEGPELVIEFGN